MVTRFINIIIADVGFNHGQNDSCLLDSEANLVFNDILGNTIRMESNFKVSPF